MKNILNFIFTILRKLGYDRRKTNKQSNVRRSTDWPEIK